MSETAMETTNLDAIRFNPDKHYLVVTNRAAVSARQLLGHDMGERQIRAGIVAGISDEQPVRRRRVPNSKVNGTIASAVYRVTLWDRSVRIEINFTKNKAPDGVMTVAFVDRLES